MPNLFMFVHMFRDFMHACARNMHACVHKHTFVCTTVLIKSNAQLIHEFFVGPLQQVGQVWKRSMIAG